ncbi:MAG: hypothetical protein AAF605_02480 [Myxococcota bacterium]
MGGDDLMIVDLATLRHMAREHASSDQTPSSTGANKTSEQQSPTPDEIDAASTHPTLSPEGVGGAPRSLTDVRDVVESDMTTARACPEASTPPERTTQRRSFTLADESPESSLPTSSQPKLRFSGAGVYGRPVRFSGDGRYQPGGSDAIEAESKQKWATEELDFEKLTASLRDHKS